MALWVILGMLAAFGLLSAVWTALGWLLPDGRGMALVCLGCPDEGIVSRYRWLRGAGLLRCPLLVCAEEDLPQWQTATGIEICGREELVPRLELERKNIDRTGNGDPAGRHQRRGVSEL